MTNYNACLPRLTNSKQTYSMVRMWPPNRMRTSMALWNVGYWNVLGRNWAASFVLDARAMTKSLRWRSEEHTSELQSRGHLVCRLLLEKKKKGQSMKVSLLSSKIDDMLLVDTCYAREYLHSVM